jgi:hypothetical protein
VSSVKYELCFYIAGDGILHSHRWENLKSYRVPSCEVLLSSIESCLCVPTHSQLVASENLGYRTKYRYEIL